MEMLIFSALLFSLILPVWQDVAEYRNTHLTTNSNTNLLLSSFRRYQFQMINKIQQTLSCETTWMDPLFKPWHMISLITMRKEKDLWSFRTTWMTHGAHCWSDHCLLNIGYPSSSLHMHSDSHLSGRLMSANSRKMV